MLINTILELLREKYGFRCEEEFSLASYIAELSGQMIYTIPLQNNLFTYNASDDYFLNHLLNRNSRSIQKLSSLFGWQRHLNHKRYQLLICSCPDEEKKQAQFHFYHQLQQMMPGYPIMRASNTCIILLYGEKRGLLAHFPNKY
ncbi:MAG: hypothetical protein LUF92_05755 [Clostridiales bacterium]|nr:hypothetical protein [Clostridiales bacterium]